MPCVVAPGRDVWQGSPMDTHARLVGRTAAVTGGTSGIGLAVVRRFVEEGADVAAIGRRARPEVESAGARMYEADVGDEDRTAQVFATIAEAIGPLDVVVLNAGLATLDADGAGTGVPEFEAMLRVNTLGVFHGLNYAPALMRDGGSVIITATAANHWAFPDTMGYSASKAPLRTMCAHAAMKLGHRGIRVNTISPGTIITPMQPDDDPEALVCPVVTCLGRVGTTEDVTGAYLFLASDDSRYVTGTDIRVDGGWIDGLTYAEVERLLSGGGT